MAVYVVSDPVPSTGIQPTAYTLTMDAGATFDVAPQSVTGGVRLRYDVTGVTNGTHNMTVKAKNMWGSSASVPFTFAKTVPIAVSGIALEES